MDYQEKIAMTRMGDASAEACAMRLSAARVVTGMSKTEFCKNAGVSLTSFLNSEAARSYPSRKVMIYLHRTHRIDFNFILHGDFQHLPGDVQERLLGAIAELPNGGDQTASSG
jgi:hypothetical protein